MKKLTYVNKFYMDKEKDVVVELYRGKVPDELTYIIRTPNHKSGNLISNLARISGLEYERDPENGLKIIKGVIPASINAAAFNFQNKCVLYSIFKSILISPVWLM